MTLIDYLDVMRRHWRLIAGLTLLGAICGGVFASAGQPMYRSSVTVLVSADKAGSTSDLVQGSAYVESLVTSYATMATSELVLGPVIEELDLDTTSRGLAGSVRAESPTATVLIDIHAERPDPVEARDLANTVAAELASAVSEVSPTLRGRPAVRVTTIQSATTPGAPFSPNVRRSAALGAGLGLMLGVAGALLLRALGGRVREAGDVVAMSPTPVLGEVVQAPRRTRLPSVVLSEPRSAEAESVRAVAANMHYLGVDGGLKSFLVTSASPAEGKSSVACALALILAERSAGVLVVDADLRSPAVHALTGLLPDVGLSNVIVGDLPLEDAVQTWTDTGVDVLTGGPVPPNPGQLLNSNAVRAVLNEAKKRYDVVIVDTGPLSLVSDAVWLGHHVDGVLVVARRGRTKTKSLARVLQTLASARTPAAGVVVNGGRRPRSGKYGYGSGYGYVSPSSPKQKSSRDQSADASASGSLLPGR